MVIGLLGGIAGGKTTVAGMFEDLGAAVLDADDVAHEELQRPETKARIREEWGEAPFAEDGSVSRSRLARIAFADRASVERLNAIMHPPILKTLREKIAQIRRDRSSPAIVCDVALLKESGATDLCDVFVFVEARDEERRRRACRQRGWSPDELARRERFQMPLTRKRGAADYVVHNGGDPEDTRRQVCQFWSAHVVKPFEA